MLHEFTFTCRQKEGLYVKTCKIIIKKFLIESGVSIPDKPFGGESLFHLFTYEIHHS